MESLGIQFRIGPQSTSLACLPTVSAGGVGASETQLLFSKADFLLKRRSVRLQSCGDLQFTIFLPKLSTGKVRFGTFGKNGCSVVPRAKLEELSTAEVVGEKKSPHIFDGDIGGREGSNASRISDQELSSTSGGEKSSFNWLTQWYPIGALKHMDKRQPYPVTVLGRDLVMWWDESGGKWQVFADACPHRSAPLSQGRINEQGHLQCSYHGWSFASSGACTMIPQAPQNVFEAKSPKRSCALAYLSKEQQGMLWVYMDASVVGKELAVESFPPLIPLMSDPDFVYDLGMSDVYHSYESLIENLIDPSHVHFSHHTLQGNRSSARPLDLRLEDSGKEGFWGRGGETQIYNFVAPCLSFMEFTLPPPRPPKGHPWALKFRDFVMSKMVGGESSKRQIATVFLCVPVAPGRSRLFFAFPRNFAKWVYRITPRWWGHLLHMAILDSDMYLLHLMERRLEERGSMANIEEIYYTPTTSDAFVVSYRKWLKNFAGGIPDHGPKASGLPPTALKTEVLDRYASHVANCTICSGALRNFKTIESVLQVLPFILIGLAAASNARPLRGLSGFTIPIICTALLCYVASQWLTRWIKKNYEFHDYNHALIK